MSELVAKVLQMTRLESGGLTLERDWCSIGEIAASVVRRLKPRLADHLVMVDIPGDLPLARVDGALIEQALGNLLENAARHTPARTLVRLRAHVHANELVVSVEDFGPGLPEGDLEQPVREVPPRRARRRGPRAGDLPRDRRAPWRPHLGRAAAGRRHRLQVRFAFGNSA